MSTPPSAKRKAPSTDVAHSPSMAIREDGPTGPTHGDGQEEDGFEQVLTKEEKRKKKKVDRKRPQFQYNMTHFRSGRKIGIAHIRDLVLYILVDGPTPGWIVPENKSNMAHVVVLFVPGLLPEHLGLAMIPTSATIPFPTTSLLTPPIDTSLSPCKVPVIPQLFTYGLPTRAPGDKRRMHSVSATMLSSPLPEHLQEKKLQESQRLLALAKTEPTQPLLYLLTPNQMIDNDYILPSYLSPSDLAVIPGMSSEDLPEEMRELLGKKAEISQDVDTGTNSLGDLNGLHMRHSTVAGKSGSAAWVETAQATTSPPEGLFPILAVDCEMVLTTIGQELARVSVVDFQSGINIFDQLVKPDGVVTDYRTQWSGITEERLAGATHTVASIQHALLSTDEPIITPHTILLGHSLECDLGALKIRHPLCIDTSVIYTHPKGPPLKPALRWLTKRWLGREIQNSSTGHDSEEDAKACVDLLKLKMVNGPEFGAFAETTEPIFDRLSRPVKGAPNKGRTSVICDLGNPKKGPGMKATTAVSCQSDDEVIQAMCDTVGVHDFAFGRVKELSAVQGWNTPSLMTASSALEYDKPTASADEINAVLTRLNSHIARLHDGLPSNSAFIVMTGQSNPLPMLALAAKRHKWERLCKTLGGLDKIPLGDRWMSEDDRDLESATYEARDGMAFFCVKG